jgi:glutamate/aspartate transport system substrate-binding protein
MTIRATLAFLGVLAAIPAAHAQPAGETLKKIAEKGEVVMSYRDAAVPFSYLDGNQQPVGYAHDICLKAIDEIKAELKRPDLKVRFQLVAGSARIPLLLNGTIDMECGTTTNTAERQKQVAFSLTYFVSSNRILTKTSSPIKAFADLAGKTVTTNAGSTALKQLSEINAEKSMGMRITPGSDLGEAFLLLENDRAQAFFLDDVLLASLAARSRNPKAYHLVGEPMSTEPYTVMVRKDDPAFKAVIDRGLKKMIASGEMQKLYTKWFEQPIPPQNITLAYPATALTKKAWSSPTDSADPAVYQ